MTDTSKSTEPEKTPRNWSDISARLFLVAVIAVVIWLVRIKLG